MVRRKKGLIFYGWIIALICSLTGAISFGVKYSFPVFYVAILKEFGWSRADTALIFSISIIVYGLVSPVAGFFVERFGPRRVLIIGCLVLTLGVAGCSQANALWHFYLLFGVIAAIGLALVGYAPNSALLANWFVRRRGTAFGIFTAGFGLVGSIALLAQWLISTMGWRMAFLVLSVIPSIIIVPLTARFIRYRPQDLGLLPDGATTVELDSTPVLDKEEATDEWTVAKAIKTYRFWTLLLGSLFIWGFGTTVIFVHEIAFFVDVGYTAIFAASIAFLHGLISIIGNLGGLLSDRIGREVTFSLACSAIALSALLLIIIKDASSPWLVYLFAISFGLGGGAVGPVFTATVADIFHGKSFGAIIGLTEMGYATGGVFGAWLAGYIFDRTNSYTPAFVTVALSACVAAICIWVASPRKVRAMR